MWVEKPRFTIKQKVGRGRLWDATKFGVEHDGRVLSLPASIRGHEGLLIGFSIHLQAVITHPASWKKRKTSEAILEIELMQAALTYKIIIRFLFCFILFFFLNDLVETYTAFFQFSRFKKNTQPIINMNLK